MKIRAIIVFLLLSFLFASCGPQSQQVAFERNLEATSAKIILLPPNDLEIKYSSHQVVWQEANDNAVAARSVTTSADKEIFLQLSPISYRFTVNLFHANQVVASSTWGKCQYQEQVLTLNPGPNNLPLIVCSADERAALVENRALLHASTFGPTHTLIPKTGQFGFDLTQSIEEPLELNGGSDLSSTLDIKLPDDPTPLGNILAFGDSGTGLPEQKKVADAMLTFCQQKGCDYGVMLGDNIYENGVTSPDDPQFKSKFEEMYSPLGIPFYVALGNHDIRNHSEGIQGQIAYSNISTIWRMPDRYYSVREGEIEYFVLDTNTFRKDKAQIAWLQDALRHSDATWKIVFGHHPLYSVGMHGLGDMIEGLPMKRLRKVLAPILCQEGADMYFAGHDHHLEVNLSKCGVLHLLSGASAKSRQTSWWLRQFRKKTRLFSIGDTLGFAHLSFYRRQALLRVIDAEGELLFQRIIEHRE